ncbi:hypothetical protein CC1G_10619 [Coprinopsis cinerea okayama7|uniref:DUF6534 domain-containing protein n=1 Tax=Coprinopsis cinerea (strain Okayama-7 / 130 / ATCC MYA-4618 / FGSC 9003) TaxID=240176 RepID=A8P8S4_COPC7|nr:hypothetical protein CC1G_10619 [Coprinopsis cinerea okayama7\|eukprot:XP_001839626.2 hypothetical protein CC1G_10619 [Coprinopsis cinerea okayama7\
MSSDYKLSGGAIEIGSQVSLILFGVETVQSFNYYHSFPDDTWYLQWLLFHAARIWRMLPRPWKLIAPLCIAATLFLSGGAFAIGIGSLQNGADVILFDLHWKWLVKIVFSVLCAIDVTLASSMVAFLWFQRKRSISRSMRLMDRLVQYSLGTGLVTGITSISMLVLFLSSDSFVWLAIFECQAKLYSNSILASLNARASLRRIADQEETHFNYDTTAPPSRFIANRRVVASRSDIRAPIELHLPDESRVAGCIDDG